MPKRIKKGKKKESKIIKSITDGADDAISSLENSSEIGCNDSRIKVEIDMPKIYSRSNSLLGTFGLLSAQKPKVIRIKKEPSEVEFCKIRDTSNSETDEVEFLEYSNYKKDTAGIKLKEVTVVVEDIFNTRKKEQVDVINEEIKQGSTDANENFAIIGEVCVEKDEELNILKQRDTNLKEVNTFLEGKEKVNTNEINQIITIANENLSTNANENLSTNANENLSTNANENLSTNAKENSSTNTYECFVADADKNLEFDDKFYIKKESTDLLVNLNEVMGVKENNTNINIFDVNKLPGKKDSSNYVNEVTEQGVTNSNKNLLCNEYSIKKDLGIMNDIKKCEDSNEISMPIISDVFVKTEKRDFLDMKQNVKVERSSAEDFEISSVNLVSNLIVKEQTATLWNMDANLDEFWMESDGKNYFCDKNEVDLMESNIDDDIMILQVICKKCHTRHTRESSCTHFPLNVE